MEAIKPPRQETFWEFLYNPEKKTIIGRTPASWGQIGFFYLIFYSCLAGFWAAMLACLYSSLDTENYPTYSPADGSSILRHPALGFRPLPREENIESTTIWYRKSDTKDMAHWINQLTDFVEPYNNQDPTLYKDCSPNSALDEKDRRPCRFDVQTLGDVCTKENHWGFPDGSPCVFLKMNRMMGWHPDYYETLDELPEEMPSFLKKAINETAVEGADNMKAIPKMVWLSCEGEYPHDEEHISSIDYFPQPGFSHEFFPYWKVPGYQSPFVVIALQNPKRQVLINLECKVWAKNIIHDRSNRLGMVQFEILVD